MLTKFPNRPRTSLNATSRADFVFAPRAATRAFSLIELIVVIAVLAVASAIAIPRYASATCHFQGDSAARRIASDFAMTASLARSSGKTQSVLFVTSGSSAHTYTIANAVRLDHKTGGYSVNLKSTYAATIVSASFSGANPMQADFDPYGACTGGSVTIKVGTYQKVITVDASSSAVTVQ